MSDDARPNLRLVASNPIAAQVEAALSGPASAFEEEVARALRDEEVAKLDDGGEGPMGPEPPAAEGEPAGDGVARKVFGFSQEVIAGAAGFDENDLGNARRLHHYFGGRFLFVERVGPFYFDGKRWSYQLAESKINQFAHTLPALIKAECAHIKPAPDEQKVLDEVREISGHYAALIKIGKQRTDEEELEFLTIKKLIMQAEGISAELAKRQARRFKWAISAGDRGRTVAMVKQASDRAMVELSEMDGDKLAVNCGNGTLRFYSDDGLWRVRLDKHDRGDKITKQIDADYDEAAIADDFYTFLERVVPDEDVRGFLQRFFGYCLLGLTSEQVLVFLYGGGRNGKSALTDMIRSIMGDYSATVPIDTLTDTTSKSGSQPTPEIARLPSVRLVTASEPKSGMSFNETIVKQLTGGERIYARHLNRDAFEFKPEFKLLLAGNVKPQVKGDDEGIWRRILLVPFLEHISDSEVEKGLVARVLNQRNGIFAWMVAGAIEFLQADSLMVPEAIRAATQEYREESDPISGFIAAGITVTGGANDVVMPVDLFGAFERYMVSQGHNPWTRKTFTTRINQKIEHRATGFGRKKLADGTRVYSGLVLKSTFSGGSTHNEETE